MSFARSVHLLVCFVKLIGFISTIKIDELHDWELHDRRRPHQFRSLRMVLGYCPMSPVAQQTTVFDKVVVLHDLISSSNVCNILCALLH